MMLMKTPTAGGTGGGTGRDVIFRLSVQPSADAPAKMRTWGESMRREQAIFAVDGRRVAKEWESAWDKAFSSVLDKSRAAAQRMAADWSGAMRGIGGGPGMAGGPMNMAGLGGASHMYDPMNMAAMARANLTQMQKLAMASARNNPMNMGALAGASGVDWGISGGLPGSPGSRPTDKFGGGFNRRAEGLNNLLHGGMNLARGMAYSGMAGEEDSQKVLDSLLRVEGTLHGIYGAVSIAKGIGAFGGGAALMGMAAPAAAGLAALVGGGLGVNAVAEQVSGRAYNNNSWSMMVGRGTVHAGSWIERGSMGVMGAMGMDVDPNSVWSYTASVLSRNKQAENAKKLKEARAGRMASDDAFAAEEFAKNDRLFGRNMRSGGIMPDGTRAFFLDKQIQAERGTRQGLLDREAKAAPGAEREHIQELRERSEERITALVKERGEIDIKTGREALDLSRQRAENAYGMARQASDAQMGVAKTIGGQFRSDMERYGSLSPLEKARVDAAARAFRAGRATLEDEEKLMGYNEYRDKVGASRAQRGMASGGLTFAPELAMGAKAAMTEAAKRLETASVAQLNVVTNHKMKIEFMEGKGFKMDMEREILKAVEQQIKTQELEYKKALDDLRREINAKERNREIIAKR